MGILLDLVNKQDDDNSRVAPTTPSPRAKVSGTPTYTPRPSMPTGSSKRPGTVLPGTGYRMNQCDQYVRDRLKQLYGIRLPAIKAVRDGKWATTLYHTNKPRQEPVKDSILAAGQVVFLQKDPTRPDSTSDHWALIQQDENGLYLDELQTPYKNGVAAGKPSIHRERSIDSVRKRIIGVYQPQGNDESPLKLFSIPSNYSGPTSREDRQDKQKISAAKKQLNQWKQGVVDTAKSTPSLLSTLASGTPEQKAAAIAGYGSGIVKGATGVEPDWYGAAWKDDKPGWLANSLARLNLGHQSPYVPSTLPQDYNVGKPLGMVTGFGASMALPYGKAATGAANVLKASKTLKPLATGLEWGVQAGAKVGKWADKTGAEKSLPWLRTGTKRVLAGSLEAELQNALATGVGTGLSGGTTDDWLDQTVAQFPWAVALGGGIRNFTGFRTPTKDMSYSDYTDWMRERAKKDSVGKQLDSYNSKRRDMGMAPVSMAKAKKDGAIDLSLSDSVDADSLDTARGYFQLHPDKENAVILTPQDELRSLNTRRKQQGLSILSLDEARKAEPDNKAYFEPVILGDRIMEGLDAKALSLVNGERSRLGLSPITMDDAKSMYGQGKLSLIGRTGEVPSVGAIEPASKVQSESLNVKLPNASQTVSTAKGQAAVAREIDRMAAEASALPLGRVGDLSGVQPMPSPWAADFMAALNLQRAQSGLEPMTYEQAVARYGNLDNLVGSGQHFPASGPLARLQDAAPLNRTELMWAGAPGTIEPTTGHPWVSDMGQSTTGGQDRFGLGAFPEGGATGRPGSDVRSRAFANDMMRQSRERAPFVGPPSPQEPPFIGPINQAADGSPLMPGEAEAIQKAASSPKVRGKKSAAKHSSSILDSLIENAGDIFGSLQDTTISLIANGMKNSGHSYNIPGMSDDIADQLVSYGIQKIRQGAYSIEEFSKQFLDDLIAVSKRAKTKITLPNDEQISRLYYAASKGLRRASNQAFGENNPDLPEVMESIAEQTSPSATAARIAGVDHSELVSTTPAPLRRKVSTPKVAPISEQEMRTGGLPPHLEALQVLDEQGSVYLPVDAPRSDQLNEFLDKGSAATVDAKGNPIPIPGSWLRFDGYKDISQIGEEERLVQIYTVTDQATFREKLAQLASDYSSTRYPGTVDRNISWPEFYRTAKGWLDRYDASHGTKQKFTQKDVDFIHDQWEAFVGKARKDEAPIKTGNRVVITKGMRGSEQTYIVDDVTSGKNGNNAILRNEDTGEIEVVDLRDLKKATRKARVEEAQQNRYVDSGLATRMNAFETGAMKQPEARGTANNVLSYFAKNKMSIGEINTISDDSVLKNAGLGSYSMADARAFLLTKNLLSKSGRKFTVNDIKGGYIQPDQAPHDFARGWLSKGDEPFKWPQPPKPKTVAPQPIASAASPPESITHKLGTREGRKLLTDAMYKKEQELQRRLFGADKPYDVTVLIGEKSLEAAELIARKIARYGINGMDVIEDAARYVNNHGRDKFRMDNYLLSKYGYNIDAHLGEIFDLVTAQPERFARVKVPVPPGYEDNPHMLSACEKLSNDLDKFKRLYLGTYQAAKHEARKQNVAAMEKAKSAEGLTKKQQFIAGEAALKGKPEKPVMTPTEYTDEETDVLVELIRNPDNGLKPLDRQDVEEALWNWIDHQEWPTEPKIRKMMSKVLPAVGDVFEQAAKLPLHNRIIEGAWVQSNALLKGMQATGDWSFLMNQGAKTAVLDNKTWRQAAHDAAIATFNPKAMQDMRDAWIKDPEIQMLIERGHIAVMDMSEHLDAPVSKHLSDDPWMSEAIKRIPLLGEVTQASERHWNTASNAMRFGLGKRNLRVLEAWNNEVGIGELTDNQIKEAAKLANILTGRSSSEHVLPALSQAFYSFRNFKSEVEFFLAPLTAGHLFKEPAMQKQMMDDWMKYHGFLVGAVGAAAIAGVPIETDPYSAMFGRVKVGKTYYDPTFGAGRYVALITQVATGERRDLRTGNMVKADRGTTLWNFASNKASPVLSSLAALGRGKTVAGKPYSLKDPVNMAQETLIPLMIQDIMDAYREEGIGQAIASGPFSFFGGRVQTITEYADKRSRRGRE